MKLPPVPVWLMALALWGGFAAGCLVLSGCGAVTPAPEPKTVIQYVDRPVAKTCVPTDLGPAPDYADTDAALKAAPGPEDRYQLLASGRLQRKDRLSQVEPVITACR